MLRSTTEYHLGQGRCPHPASAGAASPGLGIWKARGAMCHAGERPELALHEILGTWTESYLLVWPNLGRDRRLMMQGCKKLTHHMTDGEHCPYKGGQAPSHTQRDTGQA